MSQIFCHHHALPVSDSKSVHVIEDEQGWDPRSPVLPCPQTVVAGGGGLNGNCTCPENLFQINIFSPITKPPSNVLLMICGPDGSLECGLGS